MNPNQSQNTYLDALFDQIDATDAPTGAYNRLLDGTHDLIVSNFTATQSKKGLGTILGIEFIVEKSNVHSAGDKRTWAFFPNRQGFAGQFEGERIKNLYSTVDASVGVAPRVSKETGAAMMRGDFRGVLIRAHVSPAMKDGKRMVDRGGRDLSNIEFSFLGQQSAADIATRAAKCPVTVQRQVPAPQQQQQAPHAVQQPQYAPQPYVQAPAPQPYAQPFVSAPQAPAVGYPPGMQPAQPLAQPTNSVPAGAPGFLADLGNGSRR